MGNVSQFPGRGGVLMLPSLPCLLQWGKICSGVLFRCFLSLQQLLFSWEFYWTMSLTWMFSAQLSDNQPGRKIPEKTSNRHSLAESTPPIVGAFGQVVVSKPVFFFFFFKSKLLGLSLIILPPVEVPRCVCGVEEKCISSRLCSEAQKFTFKCK